MNTRLLNGTPMLIEGTSEVKNYGGVVNDVLSLRMREVLYSYERINVQRCLEINQ